MGSHDEPRTRRRRAGRRTKVVALLSAGSLLATTAGAAADPTFSDVDHDNSPHGEAISALAEQGIILGKGDGTFDPGGSLTRGQFASIVARAAGLTESDARPFPDVTGGAHAGNIAAAAEAGLILGYPDGTFRPGQPILRDQVAVLLYRWLEPPPADRAAFSDLHLTTHAAAINALADIDVVRGKADRTFDPRSDVRRDQTASMVFRALAYLESLLPGGPNPWDEVGRDALRTTQPEGDVSGVTYHGTVVHPDHGKPSPTPGQTLDLDGGTSAVNPVRYEEGDALVTTGSFGMRIYDIRDRYAPKLIGELDRTALALEGDDGSRAYHSAESLNIDKQRKLAFLSRDPRAFGNPQTSGPSGFYVIDIADATAPELLTFHQVGAGHTSTCVNSCEALWSGGPSRATTDPADWIARPILVTDVSGLERVDGEIVGLDTIETSPEPVDTGRYRGITDYSHDVQVDQQGVAWVSGRGGVRGYWTEGVHEDPTTGVARTATATDPVPYVGGEVADYNEPDDPRRMAGAIHNSERPVDGEYGESAWTDMKFAAMFITLGFLGAGCGGADPVALTGSEASASTVGYPLVQPTSYPGNFVASDDDQVCYAMSEIFNWQVTEEMRGFKIDPPTSFANDHIEVTLSKDGRYLAWESFGATVLGVIVKGGPNYNVYDYVTPGLTFDHDKKLQSPQNGKNIPQISHYNFCYIPDPTDGDQGCTPGYWRNHADRWTGVAPADVFDTVFGVTSGLGATYTLGQAIWANGGGIYALARHATAGLLNSYGGVPNGDGTTVDYKYTTAQVIAMVQAAYANADPAIVAANIEATKDLLAAANEAGCPLSGTRADPVVP